MAALAGKFAARGAAKVATKSAAKAGAKSAAKSGAKSAAKSGAKSTVKSTAKSAVKKGGAEAALGALGGAAAAEATGTEPSGFSPGGGGVAGAPCKPDSGTKINIQISGADMSASSGVFSDSMEGPGDAAEPEEEAGGGGILGGLGGAKAPAKKKDAKAPAKKKDAKAPAKKKAAKAPARKSKFTLEGARVVTGDDIAWALVGFLLVALLILI